ncbi:MAG: hypothetical protein M1834_002513 [Cirrosporium novae-zelandiae]|nr:MAG: hypothetical protein M1834_002513 [Cirrosporium novae-zelandiae]
MAPSKLAYARLPLRLYHRHPNLHGPRHRFYSSAPPNARLNTPIDYSTTRVLAHSPQSVLTSLSLHPTTPTKRLTLHQSINSALHTALSTDPTTLLFGEDIAFGGVFRCSMNLVTEFGTDRVFNTPLCEQGIVGFAIGAAAQGMKAIAEIQFADYVYPAFDQLVNEAAKFRYHTQSPESLFTHIPGLIVLLPRSPSQAKGLLLSAIASPDPVIFLEPKILYRAAIEPVPLTDYKIPLCKLDVVKEGKDVTVISYGHPLYTCMQAILNLEGDMKGVSIELIDLRTIYPWDRAGVVERVRRTGRAVIVHESMVNAGVGAEVAAAIQEEAFLKLEAPVARVAGWSTHSGLNYESFNIPDVVRVYDALRRTLEY